MNPMGQVFNLPALPGCLAKIVRLPVSALPFRVESRGSTRGTLALLPNRLKMGRRFS